jgi:mannose-6-phosphate isomerase-like protein (cupin superfamily)
MKINRDHRPWGWFEVLYEEENLKVKRILVEPGRRLSLQSHEQRAENWTVIQGEAAITIDDQVVHCRAHESIFIPRKARHRIHNTGEGALVFIEVQTGTYLGEDDITRYEDDFNRV